MRLLSNRTDEDEDERQNDAGGEAIEGGTFLGKIQGEEDAEDGGGNKAGGHGQCEYVQERAAQRIAGFHLVSVVNRGDMIEERGMDAKGLPDAGDREEKKHRGEEASEIKVDDAGLFHVCYELSKLAASRESFCPDMALCPAMSACNFQQRQ